MSKSRWSSLVSCVIDPQLKKVNKTVYEEIDLLLKKYSFKSEGESSYQILISSNLSFFTHNTNTIQIYLQDENMSFLTTEIPHSVIKLNFTRIHLDLDYIVSSYFLSCRDDYLQRLIQSSKKPSVSKLKMTDNYFDQFIVDILKQKSISALNETLKVRYQNDEVSIRESLEINGIDQDFYPLINIDESYYFLCYNLEKEELSHVLPAITECLNLIEKLVERSKKNMWLKEKFDNLNYPIVIFDKFQDILFQNYAFSRLQVTSADYLSYKENTKVKIKDDFYVIRKGDFSSNDEVYSYVTFQKYVEMEMGDINRVEELGIISSSIAHELNNPIAGILAAVNVLQLEDFSQSVTEQLSDMQASVMRCQRLIKTFLGFSKFRGNSQSLNQEKQKISTSFEQAVELLRFRLVESGMSIEVTNKISSWDFFPVNSSMFTMYFYLLLGEVVTLYQHYSLVTSKRTNHVEIQLNHDARNLILELPKDMYFKEEKISGHLINHLLDLNKAKQKVEDNKLIVAFS